MTYDLCSCLLLAAYVSCLRHRVREGRDVCHPPLLRVSACLQVSVLVLAPWFPQVVTLMVCLVGSSSILFPAMLDLFTQEFEPQERAQAQALVVTAVTFAISLAAPCFSLSFDPSASGARAAIPFAISAIACMLGLGLAGRELRLDAAMNCLSQA